MTSLSSFVTSTTFWADAKSGGGTILDVFFHPRRFVVWELSDLSVLSGSPSGSVTWTDCFRSVSSSWMSSLNRISKTRHTSSSWSSSTSGNVTVFAQFHCGMCTSDLVRQVDRAEGLLCQLEIVFLTLELLGTEFLEESKSSDTFSSARCLGYPQYRFGLDKPKQLRTSLWFSFPFINSMPRPILNLS
jgi:hypothetical protein